MRFVRRAIGPVLIVSVLVGAVLVGNGPTIAATVKQVGAGPAHTNVIEYTGEIRQNGTALEYFGYLTHVRGLPATALFVDPSDPSHDNAYMTFYGQAQIVRLTKHGDHIYNAVGQDVADIYRQHTAGADFNTPSSFKEGKHVVGLRGRLQNVLSTLTDTEIAGQDALANGVGDFRQRHVATFSADGKRYQLGHEGFRYRFSFYGWGELDNPTGPVSHIYIGGHAVRPE